MNHNWFSIWYTPQPDEVIAFISLERIAEIGGWNGLDASGHPNYVNEGNAILSKWCRINCKSPGTPVNVRGEAAWAFKHSEDAILFKLTWGGNV